MFRNVSLSQHSDTEQFIIIIIANYLQMVSDRLKMCITLYGKPITAMGCRLLYGITQCYLLLVSMKFCFVSEGNRRSLRSSFDNMCTATRMHNSFRDRSFGAAGL